MWKIVQELLPIVLIIIFATQLVIPLLFNGTIFWLFKPSKNKEVVKETPTADPSSLSEEIKVTKTIVDEAKAKVNVVKEKVEGNLKSAEDLKKDADNLI